MDFKEHQQIVSEAQGLMATFHSAKMNLEWHKTDTAKGAEAAKALGQLKTCLEDNTSNYSITVAKGIHQRHRDPHLTIEVKKGKGKPTTFHLNLSAEHKGQDRRGLEDKQFRWVGVQFSYNRKYAWPVSCVRNMQDVACPRDRRRHSVSYDDLDGKNLAFDIVAAEKRATDELERVAAEKVRFAKAAAEKTAAAKQEAEDALAERIAAGKKINDQNTAAGQARGPPWPQHGRRSIRNARVTDCCSPH